MTPAGALAIRSPALTRLTVAFARLSLAAAFLSGIASRFGWWGKGVGYGSFENFVQYTGEVNSFMPRWSIPYLAWSATAGELALGVLLVLTAFATQSRWTRGIALASAVLLALFGVAMAVSLGIKSPLDYSVFSACAAALLLAAWPGDPVSLRRGEGANEEARPAPAPKANVASE